MFLKDAPALATEPTRRASIRQRDETFMPRVVAVPVGSEVDFPNDDPIYHNVFSLSRAKTFNLGRFPRGESRVVRFDKPGIVKVFCDIHSHMAASVMVFNHPWFTVPDAEDGRFELGNVPPGQREITAWHERLGDTTMPRAHRGGRTASAGVRASGAGAVRRPPGLAARTMRVTFITVAIILSIVFIVLLVDARDRVRAAETDKAAKSSARVFSALRGPPRPRSARDDRDAGREPDAQGRARHLLRPKRAWRRTTSNASRRSRRSHGRSSGWRR